jgi:putative glutathione S-transferase
MGELINGTLHRSGIDAILKDGEMRRRPSTFRNWFTPEGEFPPVSGRYHLYVSLACPWAHRTLILHWLKGLQGIVGLSVVYWLIGG